MTCNIEWVANSKFIHIILNYIILYYIIFYYILLHFIKYIFSGFNQRLSKYIYILYLYIYDMMDFKWTFMGLSRDMFAKNMGKW